MKNTTTPYKVSVLWRSSSNQCCKLQLNVFKVELSKLKEVLNLYSNGLLLIYEKYFNLYTVFGYNEDHL